MSLSRTYTTREVAQMWNVSESTVKRWADSGDLRCRRTPGGHRRFILQDIHEFQQERGFETTGLLTSEHWENPNIEIFLNQKNFEEVCKQLLYLATRNQRMQIKELLERLYLRGVGLVEIYDQILVPILEAALSRRRGGEITGGQIRLISNNLEESMSYMFPQVIRRRANGKMGLCATPDSFRPLTVNGIARILETDGWECLNLGSSVSFQMVAEMVRREPVNLVCLVSTGEVHPSDGVDYFTEVIEEYRLPVLLYGQGFESHQLEQAFQDCQHFNRLSDLRHYVATVYRS